MILHHERLQTLVTAILEAAGSCAAEAQVVAAHLVRANLCGHDSHGVGMLPTYVTNIDRGLLCPNVLPERVQDNGSFLVYDGHRGYGQVAAKVAMEAAIARCQSHGMTVMGLRNAHHIGRVGAYGEQSLDAKLISLHFVSVVDHAPMVSPFGGASGRYGTNPLCIAVAGSRKEDDLLLDMATSRIAVGKARVALNKGEKVSMGDLIDARGMTTDDPSVLFSDPPGALVPLGDHKGYGLGLLCEVLASMMTGGASIRQENPRLGGIVNHMLTILIDPARLEQHPTMSQEIAALIAYMRQTPPAAPDKPVLVPGDPERLREAQRRAQGIPVENNTWEEILRTAQNLGLDPEALIAGKGRL